MRKNILLIVLMVTIFVFVGTMTKSAKAVDDPVSALKESKTTVHFHSMAGGDSLVHEFPTMVCTWWHAIYPPATYCSYWHVVDEIDNGDGILSPCDKLKVRYYDSYPDGTPGDSVWVHVEEVTITLVLETEPGQAETMYVEFEKGFTDVGPAFVPEAIYEPVVCDTLHEIWPEYCTRYHLSSWIDGQAQGEPGFDTLSFCDIIDITDLETMDVTDWHVIDVAIDIEVLSIPDPKVPTMTQWGVIILAGLLVSSAVFIMLRRKKAAVPA